MQTFNTKYHHFILDYSNCALLSGLLCDARIIYKGIRLAICPWNPKIRRIDWPTPRGFQIGIHGV
jgi:hypothetical protein